ncbi:restless-like transposase, partial [Pyrenophora tritici-repentis]
NNLLSHLSSDPTLSKMALTILSIPASSCECERVFSELGDLLEPRRRCISPELLAALHSVRRWRRAGFGGGDNDDMGQSKLTDEQMDVLYELSQWVWQKDGAASSIFFWKESVEKFKELLIRWIVYCHIAFFQLENQYFRELLLFLNPALLNHLPKAAKTIRSWVMNAFISKKQQLREDLHHSRSRISISFDLWTSPNPYAILGVVAMWIDTTGMRRVTALGMRRIYGEHTRENLGSVVLELLEEYDISGDQIGYFMLDNASANDTAVEFILKDLCPWMKSKQRRHRRL